MDSDFAAGLIGKASTSDVSPGGVNGGLSAAASATFKAGTRAALPPASPPSIGLFYYASDQVAFYICDGSQWHRLGAQPGDIIWTAETAARPGYVLLDGSTITDTGAFVDLFALWGATLPDAEGRTFAAIGTHADMNALLKNEGVATVANRRQKHQTTKALSASHTLTLPDHVHPPATGLFLFKDGSGGDRVWSATTPPTTDGASGDTGNPTTHPAIDGGVAVNGSIGTNVGTDPVDTGAYIVLQPQAKL